MLKDITFGQYYEQSSPVHSVDPRTKILALIYSIVLLFVAKNMISLAVSLVFILLVCIISKVPAKMYLKNLKAILPIVIFTTVINLFYGNGGTVLLSFWKLTVTTDGVYRAVYMTFRILLLITVSSVLTYTTTPNQLTDAIESLLSPLKYVGLKNAVHTLAMMMTIALRFIPTLVEETEKIMNAQKARGADLENGRLSERIKALIPILIPLLLSSVRRAYELAQAMECRCYNGADGRVRMKKLTYTRFDLYAVIFCVVFGVAAVAFNLVF